MPDIRQLKEMVECGRYSAPLLIMEYSDDSYLADTYWQKLLEGKEYRYVSIDEVLSSTTGFLGALDNSWKVCRNPERLSIQLSLATNTIVVCPLIREQALRDALADWIYTMPKLQKEHIRDWVYVMLDGVDNRYLDVLLELCDYDIRRLSQEVKKFSVLPKEERHSAFLQGVADGLFNDLSCQTIFDFTNGVLKKDLKAISKVYSEIENVDITEMYFYTVITNSFRNLCKVQLQAHPTPENTGLSSKQIYALGRSVGKYSNKQLESIFLFLTGIDKRIKEGDMPLSILRDYITLSVLTMGGLS